MAVLDPQDVPLSAFDDEDIHYMLTGARMEPDSDPQWISDLEAEYAERLHPGL